MTTLTERPRQPHFEQDAGVKKKCRNVTESSTGTCIFFFRCSQEPSEHGLFFCRGRKNASEALVFKTGTPMGTDGHAVARWCQGWKFRSRHRQGLSILRASACLQFSGVLRKHHYRRSRTTKHVSICLRLCSSWFVLVFLFSWFCFVLLYMALCGCTTLTTTVSLTPSLPSHRVDMNYTYHTKTHTPRDIPGPVITEQDSLLRPF